MITSAVFRRRCPSCGAAALQVATRCPRCREAMPSRDDRGQPLKFWGCLGCRTLNTPTDSCCRHCAAKRGLGRLPRGVWLGGIGVAAVVALIAAGVMRWPASQAAPPRAPLTRARVRPPGTTAAREVVDSVPPGTAFPPATAVISVKWVNVRRAPMPGAEILGVIKPQTTVRVLASQDGWFRVRSDSLMGWVHGQGVAATP